MDSHDRTAALRAISYGLYVLTSTSDTKVGAAAVNWLTQVSFEPPLVAVAVGQENECYPLIVANGAFAINVVGEGQLEIARAFFHGTTVEGGLINGYQFERSPIVGCPLLLELPYWMEANVVDSVELGDHRVFVGRVVGAGARDDSVMPLLLRSTGLDYGG